MSLKNLPRRDPKGRWRLTWRVGTLTVREAAELYHIHKMTAEKVAERAGLASCSGVLNSFHRHGIPVRGQEKMTREVFQDARDKGWTKGKLARHLGVELRSLLRAQKRLGFSWPERDGKRNASGREVVRTKRN